MEGRCGDASGGVGCEWHPLRARKFGGGGGANVLPISSYGFSYPLLTMDKGGRSHGHVVSRRRGAKAPSPPARCLKLGADVYHFHLLRGRGPEDLVPFDLGQ